MVLEHPTVINQCIHTASSSNRIKYEQFLFQE